MIVPLSPAGIKDAIETLGFLKSNINLASQEIVKQLVEVGKEQANLTNGTAISSGREKSIVIGWTTENKTKGYVALTGPNAVYDEFGTGEEGLASPHPMKNSASRELNPYNSGPMVRKLIDENGRHYWIYTPNANIPNYDKNGKTYGIPAGKQIYNAAKEVRARKDDVIKKNLNASVKAFNTHKFNG